MSLKADTSSKIKPASSPTHKLAGMFKQEATWRWITLLALIAILPFLFFYNLELNPRPWHDEGAALTLAKTLAEDGVYAVRSTDGYQTFGPVQSVGPTVIVPVAIVFKLFGAGLLQGRIVAAVYALLTLMVFYLVCIKLFNHWVAVISIFLLLGSPGVSYFLFGRQVLADIPAFGFFLAGYLLFITGVRKPTFWLFVVSGIVFGLASITKSQYLLILFATLGLLVFLDLFFYHQRIYPYLFIVSILILSVYFAWSALQFNYFGAETYAENLNKLKELSVSTIGINPHTIVGTLRHLLGEGSGHLFIYSGFPATIYWGYLSSQRSKQGLERSFLLLFSLCWLTYFVLLNNPWLEYAIVPISLIAIFLGTLIFDIGNSFYIAYLRGQIRETFQKNITIKPLYLHEVSTPIILFIIFMYSVFTLYNLLQADVFDQVGFEEKTIRSARQFNAPYQVAAYLNQYIDKNKPTIETWERELGILTEHQYHFPDQSMLAKTHAAIYRGKFSDYALGSEYFNEIRPDILVVGWYARYNEIYAADYLKAHAQLIATFGSDPWQYEVFEIIP